MNTFVQFEKELPNIESAVISSLHSQYTVTFLDGDAYICHYFNSEYDDNGEDSDSPDYKEWYTITFKVDKVLSAGPNIFADNNSGSKNSFIEVSRKHLPAEIKLGEKIIYTVS